MAVLIGPMYKSYLLVQGFLMVFSVFLSRV